MRNPLLFIFLSFFTFSIFSCAPESSTQEGDKTSSTSTIANSTEVEKNNSIAQIKEMEAKLNQNSADKSTANRLLMACIDFTNRFHDHAESDDYMMRAASLADGLGKYDKAIELLINYHEGYPQGKHREEAAYLVAFIYDAHIGDKQKAAIYYNKVIELYPLSKWAADARAMLNIVNKSDEELIRFLEEKNKPS
ncbi:MAG: tetratricopeptide repeat protein [Crocinitomicaceae bacterium]|nr:tetratricopeptide repeat protein [Crocinitomicaceae bacterium]